MFDEQNCGVVFMETVTSLRSQRHTVIEAIPVPYGTYEDAPAYFKVSEPCVFFSKLNGGLWFLYGL